MDGIITCGIISGLGGVMPAPVPVPVAPVVSATDSLSERTLTITVGSVTGNPKPSLSLTALMLGRTNVLGEQTGTGPWVYVVPDDASSQPVAWTVTAANSEGSATASGSEIVVANLFAPTAAGGIADQSWVENAVISTLDVAADFTGTAPISYVLAPTSAALPAGLSLSSAGMITGTPTTPASVAHFVVRGSNAQGFADTAFDLTITADPDTAPDWDVSGDQLNDWPAVPVPSHAAGYINIFEE